MHHHHPNLTNRKTTAHTQNEYHVIMGMLCDPQTWESQINPSLQEHNFCKELWVGKENKISNGFKHSTIYNIISLFTITIWDLYPNSLSL